MSLGMWRDKLEMERSRRRGARWWGGADAEEREGMRVSDVREKQRRE